MKQFLCCLLAGLLVYSQTTAQHFKKRTGATGSIEVRFYKNLEFLGFTFFLGTMGEENEDNDKAMNNGVPRKTWFAWDLALYKKYKSFKDDPSLRTIVRYEEKLQGSDLIQLLVQLKDVPFAATSNLPPTAYILPFSDKNDSTEAKNNLQEFLQAMDSFYTTIKFGDYFETSEKHYNKALTEISSSIPSDSVLRTMEQFYRRRFHQYSLIPILTLPSGMAFGANYAVNGKTCIFNAFGPYGVQAFSSPDSINMGFANEKHLRELSVHEFGHSFVNHNLPVMPREEVSATSHLYAPIRTAMDNQGYDNWSTCLNEHLVRGAEVVIARKMGRVQEAARLLNTYTSTRQFIYLPIVISVFERYDKDPSLSYEQAVLEILHKLKTMK